EPPLSENRNGQNERINRGERIVAGKRDKQNEPDSCNERTEPEKRNGQNQGKDAPGRHPNETRRKKR
ncbi:hypothetical protein, partial [Alistipes sp.]|uniref:hypothetical protein n=1 Tax=Alistipes sp. TaxID=1872444 RepID=UPI003AF1498B